MVRAGRGGGPRAHDQAQQLVRGYKLLRVPLVVGLPIARGFLVKRHEVRSSLPQDQADAKRTLFVTHVDNFVTEAQLQRCFSAAFGLVEQVVLKSVEKRAARSELRADGVCSRVNFAHVVFKEAACVDKALDAATGRIASSLVLPPPAELRERLRGNRDAYRDPIELRREVDTFMAEYDEREEEKRRIARETAVDDDGFTKVVSGITRTADGLAIRAAKRPDPKTGAFAEPIKNLQVSSGLVSDSVGGVGEGSRKKKKKREQVDFYRFQLREKKLLEIVDHRKRKAEDTEKVEYMKKKNKFKIKTAAT